MNHYTVTRSGQFFQQWEAPYVHRPCVLRSDVGGWTVECQTPEDLRIALARHRREPGVFFDLEAVCEWAAEKPGEVCYSATHRPSRHAEATQGVLDEKFLIG